MLFAAADELTQPLVRPDGERRRLAGRRDRRGDGARRLSGLSTAFVERSSSIVLHAEVDHGKDYRECAGPVGERRRRVGELFSRLDWLPYDSFYGDPPCFCIAHRDGHYLMLAQVDDPSKLRRTGRFATDVERVLLGRRCRSALRELVAAGAKIDYGLGMKPYGILEFGIQDLDEHDIGFGQPIP